MRSGVFEEDREKVKKKWKMDGGRWGGTQKMSKRGGSWKEKRKMEGFGKRENNGERGKGNEGENDGMGLRKFRKVGEK